MQLGEDWRARAEKQGFPVGPMAPPLPSELPDGGLLVVTDGEIVPMGDAFAYRQLTYSHDGTAARPGVKIVFEVRKRTPVCVSIELWSSDKGGIHASDLGGIKLDNLRDDVYAYAGVFTRNPDGGWVRKLGLASFKQDRKRVELVTRRRTLTPDFWNQVAEVCKAAPERGRTKAVRAAFNVSQRQALRYVEEARKEGLI